MAYKVTAVRYTNNVCLVTYFDPELGDCELRAIITDDDGVEHEFNGQVEWES